MSVSTYDASDRLISRQVGASFNSINMAYDTDGRVDWINHGGRIVDFDYDPSTGYLNKVTDPLTQETLLQPDAAGRVSQVTLPAIGDPAETPFIGLGHDGIGNLTSVVPSGHDATNDHELDYTPVNLLERYTPPAASGTGTLFTEYEYNGDRQLTKIKRPDGVDVVFTYSSGTRVTTRSGPSCPSFCPSSFPRHRSGGQRRPT